MIFLKSSVQASGRSIFRLLAVVLSSLVVVLMVGGISLLVTQQQKNLDEKIQTQSTKISNDIKTLLDLQASGIAMATHAIAIDEKVHKAILSGDSETLLQNWKGVFEKMKTDSRLTHFYFLDAKRTCLLRVHSPSKKGDTINRFTALEAEWTRKTASGVEIGPLGTFTLRVVQPIIKDNILIGYVELGKEIEDIIFTIHANSNSEMLITIEKKFLKRDNWESGMKMLNRPFDWNQLSQDAVIFSSLKEMPSELKETIKNHHEDHKTGSKTDEEISYNSREWRVVVFPLRDASGKEVGDLYTLADISAKKIEFYNFLILYIAVAIAIAILILILIFWLLRKVEATIQKQQQSILESEERFEQLAIHSDLIIWEVDENGLYTYVSDASKSVLGYTNEELIGKKHFYDLHPKDGREEFKKIAFDLFDKQMSFKDFENQIVRSDNKIVWVLSNGLPIVNEKGSLVGYRGSDRDITKQKHSDNTINSLAFFDQLTGLPNQALLLDRLKQATTSSAFSKQHGALFIVDLDNFKVLNDTMGHEKGDMLLKQVANRIVRCVHEGDTVARFGGDEFVIILSSLSANENDAAAVCESVAKKILHSLSQIYFLDDDTYRSSASIGITLFDGTSLTNDLMKQADLAMYKTKEQGRNGFSFFDLKMQSNLKEQAKLEDDLRSGLEENQFMLYYQAQVEENGVINGVEALIRWNHPVRKMVSPAQFIPIAEESGMILELGEWILKTACEQLVLWSNSEQTKNITIAVNVSAKQFAQDNFVNSVLYALKESGANPKLLKLELTESLLIENVESVIEKMNTLKAKGICFSLDDFGTGYSSLSYLKRLPLEQLKIDQSFVKDILNDTNDAIICKSIVALAHSMGFSVIAEGIETTEQKDALFNAGCHNFQGYLFARPMPAAEFESLLADSKVETR